MDPILAQLLAADPTLGQSAAIQDPVTPVPSVTRPAEPLPPAPYQASGPEALFAPEPQATPSPAGPSQTPQNAPGPAPTVSAGQGHTGVNFGTQRRLNAQGQPFEDLVKRAEDTRDWRTGQVEDLGARQKAAVAQEADVAARRIQDEAQRAQERAKLEMGAAQDIQTIQDAAWQRVAQSKAEYQEQLAVMRAAKIDPNRYFQSPEANEDRRWLRASSRATAYYFMASGKPALQKVGEAMVDNLDKEVDRNIRAQEANMKNGQEVADGFRMAWELAASTAVSEEQARARVKGMILQSIKDADAAEIAAKYDSDLMRAGAEKAATAIDAKILETGIAQDKEVADAAQKQAQLATQTYVARLNASVERDNRNATMAAAEGKQKEAIRARLVPDPESKEYRYLARTDDGAKVLNELGASSDAFQKSMENLEGAVRAAGGRVVGGADNLARLKNSKDQKVKALAEVVSFNLARMLNPDGRISDADAKRAADSMSIAGLLHRATGEEGRQAIRNFVLDNTQSFYGQYADDVSPDQVEALGFPRQGAQGQVSRGQRAQSNVQPPVESKVDKAVGSVGTPSDREVKYFYQGREGDLEEADRQWMAYANEGGLFRGQPARTAIQGNYVQPGWAPKISDLGLLASDTRLPQEQRVQARSKLLEIIRDGSDVEKAQFAKYVLDDISGGTQPLE